MTSGLNYKFERAFEPGVAVSVSLFLRVINVKTANELENAYDANVVARISNIEDTEGRRLVLVDTEILEGARSKRDFLRGG